MTLAAYGIDVEPPDSFCLGLIDTDQSLFLEAFHSQLANLTNPPVAGTSFSRRSTGWDSRRPLRPSEGCSGELGIKAARTRRQRSRWERVGQARYTSPAHGAIAQLGERLDRTQEVGGSSPPSSIPRFSGVILDNQSARYEPLPL